MNEFIKSQKGDALLLAEVNAAPDGMKTFLQDGDHMHMLFNFYVNQHLFASLADHNSEALASTLKNLPPIYKNEQWLNFLRLHDELSLSQLSKQQLKRTHEAFAPDENMRLYKTGIRRRLAPILNNDQDRIRMAYSLMFSMPGTHLIRYGDDIGMGDNLSLKGRSSVRTPMQWAPTVNGGFSTAPADKLVHPVISGGDYGFEKINVLTSQQQHDSLLNWLERLITTRRQCPEIAYGTLWIHPYKDKRVLIHGYEWNGNKMVFVHNFSDEQITVAKKDLDKKRLFEVFTDDMSTAEGDIHLASYGYRWLRIEN
jgi:maltose alpha-D-glucosyltransferase/alpha-amylase